MLGQERKLFNNTHLESKYTFHAVSMLLLTSLVKWPQVISNAICKGHNSKTMKYHFHYITKHQQGVQTYMQLKPSPPSHLSPRKHSMILCITRIYVTVCKDNTARVHTAINIAIKTIQFQYHFNISMAHLTCTAQLNLHRCK